MNEYLSARVEEKSIGLNLDRTLNLETGSRLFLLKRDVHSKRFVLVTEILTGWNAKPAKEEFEIAVLDSTFENLLSQSSYIGYGVPDADNAVFVYKILPDQREESERDVFRASRKFFTEREDKERFTIPVEEEEE